MYPFPPSFLPPCLLPCLSFAQAGDHHRHYTRKVGRRDEGLEEQGLRQGHRLGGERASWLAGCLVLRLLARSLVRSLVLSVAFLGGSFPRDSLEWAILTEPRKPQMQHLHV